VLFGPAHASGQHLIHISRGQPVIPSSGVLATKSTSEYTVAALYASAAACPVTPEACMVSCQPKYMNAMCLWMNGNSLEFALTANAHRHLVKQVVSHLGLERFDILLCQICVHQVCCIREGILVETHWCGV